MIQRTHLATQSLHGFLRTHLLGVNPRAEAPEFYRLLRFILALILICTAVLLYVMPASEILAARNRIHQLHAQKSMLERENARLVQEIASYSNLSYIETHARRMGYGPAVDNQQLTLRIEPAASPMVASAPAPASTSTAAEEWWSTVQNWGDRVLDVVTPSAFAARD